uniref:glucan endo-1,3-beta-D-glucosidase n=1 Tax=Thraustotheca clavata TaxID=74557 RepID=A0A0A7CM61_9STRA|nr:secreted protein [Thraustotheca clavata]
MTLTILLSMIAPLVAYPGVAYDNYNWGSIHDHFRIISERFDTIRTYQTYMYEYNAIDVAAQNNLKIYAGVWIRDGLDFNTDLQAAVDGTKRHPNTVRAIFIGNEGLMNGKSISDITSAIHQAREAFAAAGLGNIRNGTVQTDGAWLSNPTLADECDIVGVNIYPFFGESPQSASNPINDLSVRWDSIYATFGSKAMITESGWPFGGGDNGIHQSSYDNAQSYFNQFVEWSKTKGGESPIYFMFHDNPSKGGFEAQFGLAHEDGKWKYDFPPVSDHSTSASINAPKLRQHQRNRGN